MTFVGTITDAVGIIEQTATSYSGVTKADPLPQVVLSGAAASWTSGDGLVLGTGTTLDVRAGASLSVGASGLTIEANAQVSLSDAALSGPVVLAGGTLSAVGTLDSSVLVSGTGTLIADGSTQDPLVLTGAVSGDGLVVGEVVPLPAGSQLAGLYSGSFGTLVLSGTNSLPSGISVLYGETLELASAGASGGGPIAVQAGAGLTIDAGVSAGTISVADAILSTTAAQVRNVDASLAVFEAPSGTATSIASDGFTRLTNALLFTNGAGHSTVVGGNDAAAGGGTVYGGTGSVTVFGGRNYVAGGTAGNNLVVSTVGDTMAGGGSGDLLVGDSGHDLILAGVGNETLTSSGESTTGTGTGALIFGGTGASLIAAGALFDTVVAGSGATTMFGGSGALNFLDAGSGADVIVTGLHGDSVQAGSGSATVFATQGTNVIRFLDGHAGGTDIISGFKVGTDKLALSGYAGNGAQAGITNSQVTGGSTILTLADNTRITLFGVSNLGSASFV